ncbi:MAG TPA: hypothetical protein VI423_05330, partial [Paenisporosarcina sp.]|nr:hypothetical protein [Paenisporosarcina sp.]
MVHLLFVVATGRVGGSFLFGMMPYFQFLFLIVFCPVGNSPLVRQDNEANGELCECFRGLHRDIMMMIAADGHHGP